VEHKHRHILQVARALKFQAQLPTQFWGECALTAVHIINRLLSSVLSFKTPFELLYSKLLSFSHIRVFGCLVYATNVHPFHKFDFRSMPLIFIGYPTGQKAYKLFDLSSKKISLVAMCALMNIFFLMHLSNPVLFNILHPLNLVLFLF